MGDGISVPGACHVVTQEIEPQSGLSMHSSGYRTCPRLVGRQAKFEKWRFGGVGLTVNGHGRITAPEGADEHFRAVALFRVGVDFSSSHSLEWP